MENTNVEYVALIMKCSFGKILDIMKNNVERENLTEKEWTFDFTNVRFKVNVELKGEE